MLTHSPLHVELPTRALPFHFLKLYDESVLGEGFQDLGVSTRD
jgi:hypothetical protein